MAKKSETFFDRTLHQKLTEARTAVNECIMQYLAPGTNKRQSAASAALESVDRLFQLLHPNDRPAWLTDMHRDLKVATKNHADQNGIIAVQRIASELYPQMLKHNWDIGLSDGTPGFEFDDIFEKHRAEYRIPELFDELVKYLKEIVSSEDVIDSVRAINELNKIIATLQRARKGSYFATRGAWYFVAMWFKNTGWELLGSIPVAGAVFKGLQKTLVETDTQMQKLHDSIQEDLEQQIATDFPRLEYKAPGIPKIEGPKIDDDNQSDDIATEPIRI